MMIYTIVFYRFNDDGRLVETEEWEFTLRPMELRRKVVRDEFHNNLRRKDLTRKKIDMLEGKNELTDFLHNFVAGIDHKDVRKGEIIANANYSLQAVKSVLICGRCGL